MEDLSESQRKQRDLIDQLADIAAKLGWLIAIPQVDDQLVSGLVLGTQDFVVNVLDENIEEYDILMFEGSTVSESPEGLH